MGSICIAPWVTWPAEAGLPIAQFLFARPELCPFASFGSSGHILCKEALAPYWQEEVGWFALE